MWPVPTGNLRTPLRQSLQAASVPLPAELSASSDVGTTRFAMMGESICTQAVVGESRTGCGEFQAGSRNAVRVIFLVRRVEVAYGSASRKVA